MKAKALFVTVPAALALLILSVLCAGRTRGNWSKAALGEGGDVIVPLNRRDPSALVMGPSPAPWRGAAPAIERPQ